MSGLSLFEIILIIIGIIILIRLFKPKKGLKIKMNYNDWNSKFYEKYKVRVSEPVTTTLSGIKYNDCEKVIKREYRSARLKPGTRLMLVPDPDNKYDNTATRVCTENSWMLGWLPNQEWSDRIFSDLMEGKKWDATVKEIRKPSKDFNFYNLIIDLWEYTAD
jgi:hypothetical protein